MEPVTTTIVAALVAGAVAATQDVAAQAVKDAYAGLKALIIRKLGRRADVEDAIEDVEEKPDSPGRKAVLAEELDAAQAGKDAEVVSKARELLALLKEQGIEPAAYYRAELHGSGAIAQGPGAVAAGQRGVAIGGGVTGGTIVTGDGSAVSDHSAEVDTGGGAYIAGSVSTGGDFVGRDKIVHGDEVRGDQVGEDKITVRDITASEGIAIGRGAQATVHQGVRGEGLADLFAPLIRAVRQAPAEDRAEAMHKVQELQQEVTRGWQADDERIAGLIEDLVELVPTVAGAVTSVLGNPAFGAAVGSVSRGVLKRIRG